MTERNWAGNIDLGADAVARPRTVGELSELVTSSRRLRVVGSRHSFNEITRTDDVLVSLAALAVPTEIASDGRSVRVGGASLYGALATDLATAGLALPNLASLPHISVAGACATGTHGSGDSNGSLATSVSAVELVGADGELLTLRRGDPDFPVAAVNLGALGPVVAMTLDVEPAFAVRQDVYDDAAIGPDVLLDALGEAYSVSLFTDFTSERFTMAWLKRRVPDGGAVDDPSTAWRGGRLADGQRHPVPGQPTSGTTRQGTVGSWHERLPHFRPDVPPSSRGAELQSELLVPREHAAAAWAVVQSVRDRLAPVVQIAEVRSIAADDLWLSAAYGRDTVGFHVTWRPDVAAVREALSVLEPLLAPFGVRPHWGKVFVTDPRIVAERFPELPRAARAVHERDPEGRFRNRFVDALLSPDVPDHDRRGRTPA